MITLYHGSNVTIDRPDLSYSRPFKDFGKGFYLSADKRQAQEMALQKVSLLQKGEPIVTEFLFDESLLHGESLKTLIFEDYTEEWARFVMANRDREARHPIHDYDVVYGPIADDGVTYQLRRFAGGVISLSRLVEELRYAKGITFKYFFGTERALRQLVKI